MTPEQSKAIVELAPLTMALNLKIKEIVYDRGIDLYMTLSGGSTLSGKAPIVNVHVFDHD